MALVAGLVGVISLRSEHRRTIGFGFNWGSTRRWDAFGNQLKLDGRMECSDFGRGTPGMEVRH